MHELMTSLLLVAQLHLEETSNLKFSNTANIFQNFVQF